LPEYKKKILEEKGETFMMKAFKYITLTLFISSALAYSGIAQPIAQADNQWPPQVHWVPQKGRKKEPERPVEKKKYDDRGDRGGDRGDSKRDGGEKRGKKP
jgi:hypothetical protein